MKRPFFLLLLSLLSLLPGSVTALSALPDPKSTAFEHLNSENGLNGQSVYTIVQDSRGFMWLGTESGLNRYDGYTFKCFQNSENDPRSISYNVINCLLEDGQRRFWIGTGRGLNLFDPKTETFTRYIHDPKNPASLPENRVQAIVEEKDGRLWVATLGGLSLFDPKTGKFKTFTHKSDDPRSLLNDQVRSLCKDRSGNLWIGTNTGLCRYEPRTGAFTPVMSDPRNPAGLFGKTVVALVSEASGVLWIGTQLGGLGRLDVKTGEFRLFQSRENDPRSLSNNSISSLCIDHLGRFWIGTRGGGLNLLDRKTFTFQGFSIDPANPYSLTEHSLVSLFEDRTGTLWIGTITEGVNKLDPNALKFLPYRHSAAVPGSIGGNMIRGMCEDREGYVWVAYSDGGLDRFDPRTGIFSHHLKDTKKPGGLRGGMVTSVLEDHTGTMWVGTWDAGLHIFDRKSGAFRRVPLDPQKDSSAGSELVIVLHEDQRGTLWVGTLGSGLFRYDRGSRSFTPYRHDPLIPGSLADDRVLSIFSDSSGRLWVSVVGKGIDRFIPESGLFEHFEHDENRPASIRANTVYTFCEDRKGTLWIGTVAGLDRYDPRTGSFERPRSDADEINKTIYGLLEDDEGNLWFSGNDGLTRYHPENGALRHYDVRDGLQAAAFAPLSYLKTRNGDLYFGGNKGLNRIDPKAIRHNSVPPPVVFTDFLLFHKSVAPGKGSVLSAPIGLTDRIELAYADSVFSIEFSALNYSVPSKNQFAYILEGYDKDWILTDSRHRLATYTSLPPGRYVFRVKASNNDGVWNKTGTSLAITVIPPWWASWQFRAASLILTAILFFGGYRARLGVVERRNLRLKELVDERTTDLTAVNRRLTEEIDKNRETSGVLDFERRQLLSIFDASSEMIYVSDPESYEILYINSALKKEKGEVVGLKCHKVFQDKDEPCDFCTNDKIFNENTDGTYIWEHFNGVNGRWYRCFDKAIRWPDGRMVRYEMAVDIHEQKVADTQLRAAKEKAEEASREKSRFLANMSHEIRTPMTVIIGMTQLALSTGLSTEQRDYLDPVLESARSLLSLLNDILDVSKIEAKKLELVTTDFSLPDLLTGTIRAFRFEAEEKGLLLDLRLSPAVPKSLRGDPYRLRQVLVNLLGNAVKFTSEGSVTLTVSDVTEGPPAENMQGGSAAARVHTIRFEVADTGIGVPPDKHELIFENFTQAEDFLTRTHGGTGLGLSISKNLVELMGGRIGVHSEPGIGSAFFFTAPLEEGDNPEETEKTEEPGGLPRLAVLLVEDNSVIRQMIRLFLIRSGHDVALAESGEAALAHLSENRVDLVLMDIQMPGMDGVETTRRIRASQSGLTGPDVPVVALTAHSLKGDRERFLEAGMDDYVAKPVDVPSLLEVIARVIGRRGGEQTAGAPAGSKQSGPEPAAHAVFDLAWLMERLGGSKEAFETVRDLFIKSAPAKMSDLAEAFKSRDLSAVRRVAHSIKGLALQMGAVLTRDLAADLEEAAERNEPERASGLHPRLASAFEDLLKAVREALP